MSSTAKTLPSSRLTDELYSTASEELAPSGSSDYILHLFTRMRVQTLLEKLFNFSLFYIHVENAWHISF